LNFGKYILTHFQRALEGILVTVVSKLEQEEERLLPNIREFLISLNEYVNQDRLKTLLMYRRKVATFEQNLKAIIAVIEELLEK
jgi:hypothetical protein